MNILNLRSVTLFITLIITSLVLSSCENSASVDDDHSEPFGVALILSGVEIAKQENGVVTYAEGDHIELKVGEETDLISVRWIDEDGDRFTPDTGEGYSLNWLVGDEAVAEVEQHEEDGAWSFHLVGLSANETDVRFQLFHNDHSDFTSLPFEVHVEEAVSGMEVRDDAGNAIVSVDAAGTVTGTVEVDEGSQAGPFTVVFLDEEGTEINTDDDFELEWHLTGSEFATISADPTDPFTITVDGVSAGQAEAHFELISGHDDGGDHEQDHEIVVYESPDILINVN